MTTHARTIFMITMLFFLGSSMVMALPKMYLPEDGFDFGYVPQDVKVSHTFTIKSVGEDSLKIIKVTPGCSCTKAPLKKQELAPGEDTELEIIFSTGKRSGKVVKRPRMLTSEGQPESSFNIKSYVVSPTDTTSPLVVEPFHVQVSRYGTVEHMIGDFKLTNTSGKDVAVSLIDQPEEYFTVEVPKSVPAGGTVTGHVNIKNAYRNISFDKSFTIGVKSDKETRYTIPVRRRLLGEQADKNTAENNNKSH